MTDNKTEINQGLEGSAAAPCSAGWWWCCYRGEWRPSKVVAMLQWDGEMKAYLWPHTDVENWFWVSNINSLLSPKLPGSRWLRMQGPNDQAEPRQ